MNKLFKNILSSVMGLAMVANFAAVPVLADDETVTEPTSTSEITVYENYNHYNSKNAKIEANTDTIQTKSNPGNFNMSISNYDLPQIDTSKLVSVKYEVTSKASGTKNLNLYAGAGTQRMSTYNLYNRMCGETWINSWTDKWSEITTQIEKTVAEFNTAFTAIKNNGVMCTIDAVTTTDTKVDITSDTFTEFVKTQMKNGKESIDLVLDGYWECATFYSSTTSGKEPKLVFVVDDSAADTELKALTEDNFKKFVNTYASYYNIDASLINEYSGAALKAVYNKLIKIDSWNTKDGFKTAYESAADLNTNKLYEDYAGSMYFNGNNGNRQIDLNTSGMWFIANNGRKGVVGFNMPKVNLDSVKSVKLNGTFQRQSVGSANLYAFENLDPSKFMSGTTQENFDAMEKLLIKDIKPVGYASTLVFTTANTNEEKEIDVTDFVKESIKSGTKNIFFTFEDKNSGEGLQIVKPSSMQLVFEIENDSVKDEFNAISSAKELNEFILNDEKASAVGIDNSEYKKMYAPLYVANEIWSNGYTDADSLNTAINTAIAKFLVEKKYDITSAYSHHTTGDGEWTDVTNESRQSLYLYELYINLANMKNVNLIRDIDVSICSGGSSDQSAKLSTYYVNNTFNNSDISANYSTTTGELSGLTLLPKNDEMQKFNLKAAVNALSEGCTLSVKLNNTGNMTPNLNGSSNKPYFTVKYDTTKALSDFAEMDTQDEVDTFLKNELNGLALDINCSDYSKFAHPEYVASAIIDESFDDVDSFKAAFNKAMEKYTTTLTLTASSVSYYRTDENSEYTPMKQGFMAYTLSGSPSYGRVWFRYDLSDINAKAFGGKMYNHTNDSLPSVRRQKINGYSIASPNLPERKTDNLYAIDSDEAIAFNTWQTTEANYSADGATTFEFAVGGGDSNKLDITDGILNAINTATAENGSKELMLEVGAVENVYTTGITFELLVDGTVAAYEKDERTSTLLSNIVNPTTAADMLELLEAYSDVLELSSNTAYQKATDKTAVAQAVLDAQYTIYTVDDIITIINTESAKYQPTKLMEITKVTYINKPDYDLNGDNEKEGTGYLGKAYVKKYDDLTSAGAKLVAAVYDKTTGVLLGVKTVDAYEKLNKAKYGETVEIGVGAYFVMGNDTTPNTEIKVFVWDTSEGNKALADVFKTDAVTNIEK